MQQSGPHRASQAHGAAAPRKPVPTPQKRDYTLSHRGRQFRLGPIGFWSAAALFLLMTVWSAATASYFAFRDDLLTRLIARQAEMQYGYEDRIAELRTQVDRMASRQLLDQEQVEQRIEQIVKRQKSLESRTSVMSGLPGQSAPESLSSSRTPLRSDETSGLGKPTPLAEPGVPAADRHSTLERWNAGSRTRLAHAHKLRGIDADLARVETSMTRVEAEQNAALATLEQRYDARARRVRGILTELGLKIGDRSTNASSAATSGIGGPFVPVSLTADPGAFENQVHRVHLARAHFERLSHTLVAVPVRKPLEGELETTSTFGVRVDPFFRSPAMHSGLDFRGGVGEPVRATAAGVVVSTGWNGGYGRMIEVDHGNGFSTRYGHLSEILVKEDQAVRPGQIIGRVGSTGRSTGPHLHYETRIDGEAVDPQRFLRAGLRLGEEF